MKELSLNLLDVAQNSLTAGATLVEIGVIADTVKDMLTIYIKDNGSGMSEEQVKSVTDPFFTTRKTRKIGLGIPLLNLAAAQTGGELEIESKLGVGTKTTAKFVLSSIDRMPLGDLKSTITTLIGMNDETDFLYIEQLDDVKFELDTRQLKEILGDVPLSTPDVMGWIYGYYDENSPFLNTTY